MGARLLPCLRTANGGRLPLRPRAASTLQRHAQLWHIVHQLAMLGAPAAFTCEDRGWARAVRSCASRVHASCARASRARSRCTLLLCQPCHAHVHAVRLHVSACACAHSAQSTEHSTAPVHSLKVSHHTYTHCTVPEPSAATALMRGDCERVVICSRMYVLRKMRRRRS